MSILEHERGPTDRSWARLAVLLANEAKERDREMNTYRVTGIAVDSRDWRHEHITDLLLEDRYWVDRHSAAVNIQSETGDKYYTNVKGQTAWVIVVGCPACSAPFYLRTTADASIDNNLLSLPKYRRAA